MTIHIEVFQTFGSLREESVSLGHLSDAEIATAITITKQAANVTDDIPPERAFDYRFVKQAEQELKGWNPRLPR